MKVNDSPRAADDLEDILSYLDERSPQGARNVKNALYKAIALIGRHPEIGRKSKVDRDTCSSGRAVPIFDLLEHRSWRGVDRAHPSRTPAPMGGRTIGSIGLSDPQLSFC
jgi:plasmid stabilization system protein ParE